MIINTHGSLYAAVSTFAEKDLLKAAGFRFHGRDCSSGRWGKCKACPSNVPVNAWWTDDAAKVGELVRLHGSATGQKLPLEIADPALLARASKGATAKTEALEASHAVDAAIDVPAPAGLAYLPYQLGGIAYMASKFGVATGNGGGQDSANAKRRLSKDGESTEGREGESGQGARTGSAVEGHGDAPRDRVGSGVAGQGVAGDDRGHAPAGSQAASPRRAGAGAGVGSAQLSWGERAGADRSSGDRVGQPSAARVRDGATDPDSGSRDSALAAAELQGGFRRPEDQDRDRAGRAVASPTREASRGREEDGGADRARLDGQARGSSPCGVLLGDEPGLGKTIQILGLINLDPTIRNVLIVCPSSIRINWLREAQKWLTRRFVFHVVDEAEAPPAGASFVVVGYPRLSGKAGKVVHAALMARNWDLIAVDEAHFCKSVKAQRTVAVIGKQARKDDPAIDGLIHASKRSVFATGTPILNKPVEIQPLLAALAPSIFGNFFMFAKRYCDAKQVPAGRNGMVWDFSGASHLDELQLKLREHVMVRRLKKDVLTDLPPKRRQIVLLPLNGAASAVERENAAYDAREERLADLREQADLASAVGDSTTYEQAVAALREAQRLAFTEIAAERHRVAVAKIPACIEHVRGVLDEGVEKCIVFAHHRDVLAALAEEFGDEAVTLHGETPMAARQVAVDRFQTDPSVKIFLGSITAAGVGLTLTASSHVVFCELTYVPAEVSQAEDRAHRIGQRGNVLVQHLVVDGSLDARMVETIVAKQAIADAALDTAAAAIHLGAPVSPRSRRAQQDGRPEVYPVPTDEVRRLALYAMQALAGACDGARAIDGHGFNKVDSGFGKRLAECSSLTDGQVWAATKLARKYRRQLGATVVDGLGIGAAS